jgi:hypothetical protein
MKSILYIFSLVAMGFPMPGWVIPHSKSSDGKLETPNCISAGDRCEFFE